MILNIDTKHVIPAVIIIHILGAAFGFLLFYVGGKHCLTEKCRILSITIKDYIHEDVNPCNDFYKFSCGKMLESPNATSGLLEIASEKIMKNVISYLNDVSKESKPKAFYQGKKMFHQCLKTTDTEVVKANMAEFINDCGGFPAIEGAAWERKSGNWSLLEGLRTLRSQGLSVDAFFSLTYRRSPSDSAKYIMSISKQRSYPLFKPPQIAMCFADCQLSMIAFYSAVLVAAGVNSTGVDPLAKELFEFDMKIANLTYNRLPPLPHTYKNSTMTIETFTKKYDFFNWIEYFKFMLKSDAPPKDAMIIVEYPDYLDDIKQILSNSTNQQLANYLVWYNLMNFLYFPNMKRSFNYCYNMFMVKNMPELLSTLSVHVRDDSTFSVAKKILRHIANQIVREIKASSWLDDITKREALEKIKNVEITIGYLPVFTDDKLLDEYYNMGKDGPKLEAGNNFYHSYRELKKFRTSRESYCFSNAFTERVCQLMLYGELGLFSMEMYYDPSENQIVVPDAMLRYPVFLTGWPRFIYYSRLGFFAAHEFIHIFDEIGAHYNKRGNLTDWWDKTTFKKFQDKVSCIVEQFSHFQYFDGNERKPLPVYMSKDENIADNGGLPVAYYSFQRNKPWPSELMLPDMKYSSKELFFITLAQMFCDRYLPTELPLAFWSVHAPRPIRVEEIMQNSKEFARIFRCDKDTEFNPTEKCSIW